MAVKKTIQIGNPLLKAENKIITDYESPKVKQVIQDLVDTMRNNNLIGMAAPQIGENYKIFVTEPRETKTRTGDQTDALRIYINPKMEETSDEDIEIWEGCGCVANATLFAPVLRPKLIKIQAIDQKGKPFSIKTDGILGRVIQHEYDHMFGIEFVEKISDYAKLMDIEFYIKNIRSSEKTKRNSKITVKEIEK